MGFFTNYMFSIHYYCHDLATYVDASEMKTNYGKKARKIDICKRVIKHSSDDDAAICYIPAVHRFKENIWKITLQEYNSDKKIMDRS